jgi:hypothetical protein
MKNIVQTMQDKRHDPFSRVETIVSEAISREITPRFGLLHELHEEHMLMIHFRITASVEKTLMPGFIELLEEGVKLGVFKSKNIEEVAETLFATIQYFSHLNEFRNSEAKQRKVCRFLEQMIEKLLATHPRKFTITLDKTMGANSLEKILVRQPSVKEVHP